MKKAFLAALALSVGLAFAVKSDGQDSEYRTMLLDGTADIIIDSTYSAAAMKNKRLYINGIYAWYDNGVNTNPFVIQVVSGTSALRTQGARRQFYFYEAMTSGGIKSFTFTPNITTQADSAVYVVISATGSDTLRMAVNYKIVGN